MGTDEKNTLLERQQSDLEILFYKIGLVVGLHESVEEQWLLYLEKNNIKKINLNSKEVRDYDDDIDEYVRTYRNFISLRMPYFNKTFIDKGFQRIRVKEVFSIKDKIQRYNESALHGKVILNKCLNDILGARILVPFDFDIIKFGEIIDVMSQGRTYFVDARKEVGYKGLHIYIKNKLGHFRWEIQVWYNKDHDNNIKLHERYKRGYLKDLKDMGVGQNEVFTQYSNGQ